MKTVGVPSGFFGTLFSDELEVSVFEYELISVEEDGVWLIINELLSKSSTLYELHPTSASGMMPKINANRITKNLDFTTFHLLSRNNRRFRRLMRWCQQ